MIIRIISYLLYILIAGAGIVLFLDKKAESDGTRLVPTCNEPLTYRIGEIDNRFRLTQEELRRFLNGAGKLWSDAAGRGRQLLEYDTEGEITVHMIYDERQELIESEMDLASRIQEERLKFDRLHRDYLRYANRHREALENYETTLEEYQKKLNEHNERVDIWNSKGSDSGLEEQHLLNKERELQQMSHLLEQIRDRVNSSGESVIELNDRLDEISGRKDNLIQDYNNQFAGEYRFSQGEYVNRDGEQKINIYHYQSLDHLRLVLAHEVGHALGLAHAETPESVMYPVVQSSGRSEIRLSSEDVAAILSRCN